MAKTLKKIKHIIIESDGTGLAFGRALALYEIGSTDDTALKKEMYEPLTLSGADITSLAAIFNTMKGKIQTKESV